MTTWTPDRVRDELPEIVLLVGGTECPARITGRLNRFATVRTRCDGAGYECEAAWSTLAKCLNENKPLRY